MTARLLTTRDAMLGVVVGAIHADGKVVEAEVREAQLQMKGLPSLEITPLEVVERLPGVKLALTQQGEHEFLVACVAAMSPDLRVRAFRAASEVVVSDREVLPAEERYLSRLATAMQIALTPAPGRA